MWAICRISVLGTEILSIEVGHQQKQPEIVDDDPPAGITGGSRLDTDLRDTEDVRDTAGWLGFRP